MHKERKIAVVTGTRADYGIFYSLLREIESRPSLTLQLIVTGMHLSPTFGLTVREIEADGFPIAERVPMLLAGDGELEVATSMGIGLSGMAGAYQRLRPDILVLLGDRFEIASAALAASPFRIPIAHLHGGEETVGAFDNQIRHAITKLSHLHFTSTAQYRDRVIAMGELPERVFNVGALALDHLLRTPFLSAAEIRNQVGIPEHATKIGILTFHPVTLEKDSLDQFQAVLQSVAGFGDVFWVITYPNADVGNSPILSALQEFASSFPDRCRLVSSLGVRRYFSLMKIADLMVGNSSSGIIEAPSFGLPVVNVGSRQQGRTRGANVIDVDSANSKSISGAIKVALCEDFHKQAIDSANPYAPSSSGSISSAIVDVLATVELGEALIKKIPAVCRSGGSRG